ncbi:MAG: methyltransferase domain-containing protein, partial [Rikenellaceae bacterium]
MIDKKLIEHRFATHFATYNNHAKVQEEICVRLSSHIKECHIAPKTALEIGAGTGFLTKHLLTAFPTCLWYLNDLTPKAHTYLEKIRIETGATAQYMFGDAENMHFSEQIDLITSASTIQWFDNIELFLNNLNQKSGSKLAISTFSTKNFNEIAKATQTEGLTYPSSLQLQQWLTTSGYTIDIIETYITVLNFDSPIEVLRHLKYTGVNAIKAVQWSKRELENFTARYNKYF